MWGTKRYDVDAVFGPHTNLRAFDTIYDPGAGCVRQDGVSGFAITVVRVFKDLKGNGRQARAADDPLQPGRPHHLRSQARPEAQPVRRRSSASGAPSPSPSPSGKHSSSPKPSASSTKH